MKKGILVSMLALVTLVGLVGCADTEIMYEGEMMPKSEVGERLADKLEVENPDMDLEIQIYEESDE